MGEVVNGTFRKTVSASRHFLRVPEAIANSLDVLAQAKEAGAQVCEIYDRESRRTYRASFDRIWKKGFAIHRDDEQIALALSEWNRDGETVADQLTLWGA